MNNNIIIPIAIGSGVVFCSCLPVGIVCVWVCWIRSSEKSRYNNIKLHYILYGWLWYNIVRALYTWHCVLAIVAIGNILKELALAYQRWSSSSGDRFWRNAQSGGGWGWWLLILQLDLDLYWRCILVKIHTLKFVINRPACDELQNLW